ncbi:hypothetical protein F0562_022524 [Nyssa sinensis]|uniref:Uncharacterized protein n=1 Tax=Nyssa sinensis TaxID=561372 RepID=A0A5J5BNZ3_9ASTE|nr:hypothetical protein F0562_022524 [Nyssa sinensis]
MLQGITNKCFELVANDGFYITISISDVALLLSPRFLKRQGFGFNNHQTSEQDMAPQSSGFASLKGNLMAWVESENY